MTEIKRNLQMQISVDFTTNLQQRHLKLLGARARNNIEPLGDVEENKTPQKLNDTIDNNFDERVKHKSVYCKRFESKSSAFHSKKMGKTQFFNFKYTKKNLNKKSE